MSSLVPNTTGNEIDWLAIDKDNHVGHFSTAGFGPLPKIALTKQHEYKEVLRYLLKTQGASNVRQVIEEAGDCSEWLQVASHGIFSYDYGHWNNKYTQVALPLQPILIFSLPEGIQKIIRRSQVHVDCFAKKPIIDFNSVTLVEME